MMINDRIRRLLPAVLASLIILLGAGTAGPQAAPASSATTYQHQGPGGKDTVATALGQPHQFGQPDEQPLLLSAQPAVAPPSAGHVEYVAARAEGPAGRGIPGQGSRAPPTTLAST